jgi:hypothetical protein
MLKIAFLATAMLLAASSAGLWAKSLATHTISSAPHGATLSPYNVQLQIGRALPDQEIHDYTFVF